MENFAKICKLKQDILQKGGYLEKLMKDEESYQARVNKPLIFLIYNLVSTLSSPREWNLWSNGEVVEIGTKLVRYKENQFTC